MASEEQQFNPGDTVELKSGGPPMTIIERQSSGQYLAKWFVKHERVEAGIFPEEALKLVDLSVLLGGGLNT